MSKISPVLLSGLQLWQVANKAESPYWQEISSKALNHQVVLLDVAELSCLPEQHPPLPRSELQRLLYQRWQQKMPRLSLLTYQKWQRSQSASYGAKVPSFTQFAADLDQTHKIILLPLAVLYCLHRQIEQPQLVTIIQLPNGDLRLLAAMGERLLAYRSITDDHHSLAHYLSSLTRWGWQSKCPTALVCLQCGGLPIPSLLADLATELNAAPLQINLLHQSKVMLQLAAAPRQCEVRPQATAGIPRLQHHWPLTKIAAVLLALGWMGLGGLAALHWQTKQQLSAIRAYQQADKTLHSASSLRAALNMLPTPQQSNELLLALSPNHLTGLPWQGLEYDFNNAHWLLTLAGAANTQEQLARLLSPSNIRIIGQTATAEGTRYVLER